MCQEHSFADQINTSLLSSTLTGML